MVEEFEDSVRRYCGAKYAVAVSSCTAGLYLALNATYNKGPKYNNVVLIPAFTFPAANMAVSVDKSMLGICVDVDKETYNSGGEFQIEMDRNPWIVRWIIAIDQFGLTCDMETIENMIKWYYTGNYKPTIIRDSACSLGSEYKGEKVGHKGTCVFSFHGRKIITTGEGGMVVTDDEELYEAVLRGRQFGRDKTGCFCGSGLNWKMSDISAAIGCAQMEKLPAILRLRDNIAHIYWRSITSTDVWTPNQHVGPDMKTNWQSYVVRLSEHINRDEVIRKMREKGIEVTIGSYDNSEGSCKNSAVLAKTTLALPIWPGMDETMIERVVTTLEEAMK
jgi:perosamine synthetase